MVRKLIEKIILSTFFTIIIFLTFLTLSTMLLNTHQRGELSPLAQKNRQKMALSKLSWQTPA